MTKKTCPDCNTPLKIDEKNNKQFCPECNVYVELPRRPLTIGEMDAIQGEMIFQGNF